LDDLGLEKIPEGDWFCDTCVATRTVEPVKTVEAVEVPKSAKKPSKMPSKGSYKSTPVKSKIPATATSTSRTAESEGRSRKRTAEGADTAPEGRRSARLL
jgi:hypothetical protein